MAACGSLQHIFPESPTFIESISSRNQSNDSSFTEIFGELHFKENHSVSSSSFSSCLPASSSASSSSSSSSLSFSSSSSFLDAIHQSDIEGLDKYDEREKSLVSSYDPITSSTTKQDRHTESFSSRTSDSLSMCTEGLGFESSDDVEDLINDLRNDKRQQEQEQQGTIRRTEIHESRSRSTRNKGSFPPPISCIGRSGKPWVSFKSFREDGRFILKEIRIPTQEILHACREDGRLMMHVIHSDDEILDDDDEEINDSHYVEQGDI